MMLEFYVEESEASGLWKADLRITNAERRAKWNPCNLVFLKQGFDLGEECAPTGEAIFVARANDFDGRDESPIVFVIVNPDFVFVEFGDIGFQGESRARPCFRFNIAITRSECEHGLEMNVRRMVNGSHTIIIGHMPSISSQECFLLTWMKVIAEGHWHLLMVDPKPWARFGAIIVRLRGRWPALAGW